MTELASRAHSPMALAEMMAVIVRLCEAELLVPPEHVGQPLKPIGFASAAIHVAMLNDRQRTGHFLRAVRETVKPGDVVVDLGTGTGVLAIAAAQAGARRVYAIEATGIADAAEAMVAENGVADRVSIVRGWSTQVTLDEPADVLVSETLGHDPWEEGFLHLVSDARRRLLRPDARVIPSHVRLFAQPVSVPESHREVLRFDAAHSARWREWYDIDFSPLPAFNQKSSHVRLVRGRDTVDWPRPCPAVLVHEVDVQTSLATPSTSDSDTVARETGTVDGVLLYWQAQLAPGICLSTEPRTKTSDTHWRARLVLAPQPCQVDKDQVVSLSMTFDRTPTLTISVA